MGNIEGKQTEAIYYIEKDKIQNCREKIFCGFKNVKKKLIPFIIDDNSNDITLPLYDIDLYITNYNEILVTITFDSSSENYDIKDFEGLCETANYIFSFNLDYIVTYILYGTSTLYKKYNSNFVIGINQPIHTVPINLSFNKDLGTIQLYNSAKFKLATSINRNNILNNIKNLNNYTNEEYSIIKNCMSFLDKIASELKSPIKINNSFGKRKRKVNNPKKI